MNGSKTSHTPLLCLPLLALLMAALTACATPVDPNYMELLRPAGEAPPSANTIGPSDKISIRVYQEEKLGGDFVISPDGTLNFPYIGKVEVVGKTCSQVEDLLTERLSKDYLRNPSVTCSVREFNSKKIVVLGEVKKPGNFRYEDQMSVVQAITSAGGFTDRAAPNGTTLVRVVQGEKVRARIPMEAIIEGTVESLSLQPGDVISVPRSIY